MKAVRIGVTVATTVAVVTAAAPAASASPVSVRSRSATCTILSGAADSSCTPGATNPDVTQDTIDSTICVPGWTAKVRPPASYTTALKNRQKAGYGEADLPNSALEEDHLIPLELGGAPRDPANLWPEPRASADTTGDGEAAEDKDREENALKRQVCAGTRTLDEARQQILADWTH